MIQTLPPTYLWERSCLDAHGSFSAPILSCHVNGAFDLTAPCRQAHGAAAHERDAPGSRNRIDAAGAGGGAAA